MGEEANVSYAYLKAMQRKRKTGAERERERERERGGLHHGVRRILCICNLSILGSFQVYFMKKAWRTGHYSFA